MKIANIIALSILSVMIVSLAKANQPIKHASIISQGNCSYSIEIATTCAPSAETTDHVSVGFSDHARNLIIVKHLKNPKLLYDPKNGSKKPGGPCGGFQRCRVDMPEASGACMKQSVCALSLKRVGSDELRPGWVK